MELGILLLILAPASTWAADAEPGKASASALLFADEFNAGQLDRSK